MSEKTNDPVNPGRRNVVAGLAAGTVAVAAGLPEPAAAQSGSNAWGWPQPYQKVSDKSVAWLKVGLVAARPGLAAAVVGAKRRDGGDGQTGLPRAARAGVKTHPAFTSGPALNEVFISTRIQVGVGGNFPLNSLVDKQDPASRISIVCPNLRHHVIVPPVRHSSR